MNTLNPQLPAWSPSPVEREIDRARDLTKAHRHGEALAALDALLAQFPENRDALYLRAMNLRYLGRFDEALQVLGRLQQLHPRYSRLHQERGHVFVALRDAPKAIEAFLQGVNLNPALPASWDTLQRLYTLTGDAGNAATAADHVATLRKLPPEVIQAGSFFSDGELGPAENIVRGYLLKAGDHVEAMRLLARIGLERDVPDDAEVLLEAVLERAPDYHAARMDYARALYKRQKYQAARQELERLLKLDPENREYLKQYAATCVMLGQHASILDLYHKLLAGTQPGNPEAADLHLWLAHALKTTGQQQAAIEEYQAATAARPGFGDAYWSLANLKTWLFAADQISRMREQEAAAGISPVDRYHLCFALGKALEDQHDYAASWQH